MGLSYATAWPGCQPVSDAIRRFSRMNVAAEDRASGTVADSQRKTIAANDTSDWISGVNACS